MVSAAGEYRGAGTAPQGKEVRRTLDAPQLFDLSADPAEENNLYAAMPDKAKELQSLLDRYREQGFSRPDWKK
jgi:hypothetical protein